MIKTVEILEVISGALFVGAVISATFVIVDFLRKKESKYMVDDFNKTGLIGFTAYSNEVRTKSGVVEVEILEEMKEYYKINIIGVSGVSSYLKIRIKTEIPKWIKKDKVTIKE